jgi:hypothetical protein
MPRAETAAIGRKRGPPTAGAEAAAAEAPPTAGAETAAAEAAVSAAADGEAGLLVCLAPYPARQLHICEKCVSCEKERINKLQSPLTMIVILRAWIAHKTTSYTKS